MKHLKHSWVLLFAVCTMTATAQVPSGNFNYVFTNTPLWDVTGSYTNETTTSAGSDSGVMDLVMSDAGKITGTRMDTVVGTVSGSVDLQINGKIVVMKGVTGAMLMLKGTAEADGFTGPATGKVTATLNPATLEIEIDGSVKACLKTPHGTKCETIPFDVTKPVPAGMTGDWSLATDITASSDKLSGTGTVTLSNGRTLEYQITGTYVPTTEVAKLKLMGTGAALGTSLSITTHGSAMTLTGLKSKLLGQTPAFP